MTQVIYESDALEVLRIEMDAGSVCESGEFGDFRAVHFVIGGNPGFRSANRSADLVPGDSIVFSEQAPYTVTNGAPSRSVILSVLFRPPATDVRA
ncbi:MAG: hypothetical protein HYU75_18995 [Betaproteobacteria bacterium]|nr:hypothetical protein [Betaproteobacteria bacterium]